MMTEKKEWKLNSILRKQIFVCECGGGRRIEDNQ